MGEIADMMLDGTMCECCGEFINEGADGPGFPQYCSPQCAADRGAAFDDDMDGYAPTKNLSARRCDTCGKICKTAEGVQQHQRDKHGLIAQRAE